MRVLIQRVRRASVTVAGETIGAIDRGLLAFVAVQKDDTEEIARRLLEKVLAYRVFSDEGHRMNLNLRQIEGSLLIVSQFTLAANTRKGLRPGFSTAAPPQRAKELYEYFVQQAKQSQITCETGEFAADMQVELINDGPVTFLLES